MQQMSRPRSTRLDEFRTSDLGIAAFLVAQETPLLRVENGGERTFFVFPGSAEEAASRFYQPGKNLVDARRFHFSLRELRGLTKRYGGRP
jgi:hypothetical protein